MEAGRRNRFGVTLLEVVCVATILAALLAISLPALARVKERAKLARSMSNMRQIHVALMVYVEQHDGTLESLPYDFTSLREMTGLPKELLHTGGRPVVPGEPHSDVYRYMWPSRLARSEDYRQHWQAYVSATQGNPVLIIDDTFPNSDVVGPFVTTSHYGLFWSGQVAHRRYGGTGQNLFDNWK
jgi:type II secretory pathway pseudopilin PulG